MSASEYASWSGEPRLLLVRGCRGGVSPVGAVVVKYEGASSSESDDHYVNR